MSLVKADLLDEAAIDKAIEGSTYVAHVASPFVINEPKDEQELIRPAVEGTLVVMRACRKHKVKRVVLTSSLVSIMYVHEDKEPDDGVYDETHWSDPSRKGGLNAYEKSKVMAERAAWDFLESLPKEERFELSTVNPGLVVGPSFIGGDFSSGKIVSDLMMN